ncbi:hypothetical protein NEUTE2DRAFT_155194 [Neurospora tetrasperma FGSC 2509]|nr:hypothetical protein NEUTE2DRAFT_155194 [Neurospora tetrasperma FGSC 2509]
MDPGPSDPKRPRLSTTSSWSVGGAHYGVSLLHPTPSPTAGQHHTQHPHHPNHPTPSPQYQQTSPHPFSRPPGPGDPGAAPAVSHPHPPPPPPPPPPAPSQQGPVDDRRHHEPDRYPPMQDHRQHHPSSQPPPAHHQYNSGYHPPPREVVVKQDPADDSNTPPHLRRPNSTGHAPDGMTPGTPMSALPHQGYPDDKRHMSYDNGPQQNMYRQPSFPPQTPMAHGQPYDYPPHYGHHGDLPYIQLAPAAGKRKAQRAAQACDMCRQLKAKCDELKPCKSCRDKKVECKYREAVPKQQDKVAADILENLMGLRNEFSMFNHRITRLEKRLERVAPPLEAHPEMMSSDDDRPASADSAVIEDGYNSSSPGGSENAARTQAPIDTQEARNITKIMDEEREQEPGPFVRPGAPAIPLNHTTLAALLLKWKSIKRLAQRFLDAENIKFVEEYPIRQEERRGLLRLWGRGEGLDSSRMDRESNHNLGMMEVIDDYSETGAPSPADCWGGISGSPGPMDHRSTMVGVQTLDFSEETVWKYVQSYLDNIQNMHPLIIPRELHAMVRLFLDGIQQSTKKPKGSAGIAKFVGAPPLSVQGETGAKRKRSPVPDGADSPTMLPRSGKPTFQRSINNALVLLVLALGKICLIKDRKLPDVVPVSEPSHGSPMVRNGYPASPIHGSPPSYSSQSHSAGLPSPKDSADRSGPSRRQSFQGGGAPAMRVGSLKRNMDVIPGLDYFAYATDILGGQLAGTSLRHIHAYILAGLYHGQLGRVMESYAYIKEAGWALQIKMRPDIVAELPLPQSHILAFEEIMPYPNINLAKTHGFEEHVLQSYLAQLYLRKSLNQIHQMLYNPEDPRSLRAQNGTPPGNIIEVITKSLDLRFVPPEYKFTHEDPPAGDLLSARLRAKYWGAQVITYRPYIRQILESNMAQMATAESPMPASTPSEAMTPLDTQMHSVNGEITQDTIEYAKKGIRALIESTRAFHGLPDKRFVVTNIFGTAHAQWGNLLTLAAVFRDPTLHPHVDEQTLKELFSRTIAFFRIIAQPTSALAVDMRILEGLERELWHKPNSVDMLMGNNHHVTSFVSTPIPGPPPPPSGPRPATHSAPPLGPPGPSPQMPRSPIPPMQHNMHGPGGPDGMMPPLPPIHQHQHTHPL